MGKRACALAVAVLAATALSSSATSGPNQNDAALRKKLIGSWTPASDDQFGILGAKIGIFGLERFNADGTGSSTIYRGKICGEVKRVTTFQWVVVDGVLITKHPDNGKDDRDKIVQLTEHRLVLSSMSDL